MSAPEPIPLTVPHQPGKTDLEHDREQIRVLMVHARHQASQIAELTMGQTEVLRTVRGIADDLKVHVKESAEWRPKMEATISRQGEELARNTQITQQVDAALTTAKTIKVLVGWAGAIGMGIVGIWALVKAMIDKTPGVGP